MRILLEGSLLFVPAVALVSFVQNAPREGASTLLFPIGVGLAAVMVGAALVSLRRAQARPVARGAAALALVFALHWSLIGAALAAAWTFWALVEVALEERPAAD